MIIYCQVDLKASLEGQFERCGEITRKREIELNGKHRPISCGRRL